MFEIFEKKQKYGQVSSKFKSHFHVRQQRFAQVLSKDVKIQQKMQIFKQLINDDRSLPINKVDALNITFVREKKKIRPHELQQSSVNDLMQMTDGIAEWSNIKHKKHQIKQNPFNWDHYKDEKKLRKKYQYVDVGQVLKQKLKLRQLPLKKNNQRLQNQIKWKIQHNIQCGLVQKPFHLSYRNTPQKQSFFQQQNRQKSKQKFKLAKYFGQMKQFNCHQKYHSQLPCQNAFLSSFSTFNSESNTPANFISWSITPSLNQSLNGKKRVEISQQIFQDKEIYAKMEQLKSQPQNGRLKNKTFNNSNFKKSEQNQHVKPQKQQMFFQRLQKLPENVLKQINVKIDRCFSQNKDKFHRSREFHRSRDQDNGKKEYDMKKINALKKVKCL